MIGETSNVVQQDLALKILQGVFKYVVNTVPILFGKIDDRRMGQILGVNQNMRYDQSVRACKDLLNKGLLGKPIFGTIDMRATPHWTGWQAGMGWLTLRVMSIHHLDAFRHWFGDPKSVYCNLAQDPRTISKFAHEYCIAMYIFEYENGIRASSWDDVWTGPVREGAEGDIYRKYRFGDLTD